MNRTALTRSSLSPADMARHWAALVILASLHVASPIDAGAQQLVPGTESPIERLKARVRAESPSLGARRASLEVAIARRQVAGTVGPASLNAEAEEVPSGVNLFSAGSLKLNMSREFVPRPRLAAERALANQEIERARLEVELTTQAIGASVDQLVARASGAAAIATRLASEDSLLVGTEEAVRSRFSVGDARYVGVLRLRTERLHVATELQRTRSDARVARLQILRLAEPTTRVVGESSAEVVALTDAAIAAEAAQILDGALPMAPSVDSLLARSGAVRLAALDVQRAEAARRLVLADQRPSLQGAVGMQRFTNNAGGYSLGPTLGVSVTLPFTARRGNEARQVVAEREIVLANATQRTIEYRVTTSLAAALDRYETARSRLTTFDVALLRGAREEREAALASFRTGSLTLLELLDFERALAEAEISRIRSRVDAADALVDLYLIALGSEGQDALSKPTGAPHLEND